MIKVFKKYSVFSLVLLLAYNSHAQSNSFGFGSTPSIHILTPNSSGFGGCGWVKGEVRSIIWKSNIGGNVRIELYNGNSLVEVIASSTKNDSLFSYFIPRDLPDGHSYRVKITSIENPSVSDYSDVCSIVYYPGSITVTDPTEDTIWYKERIYPINWSDNLTGPVHIQLYQGPNFVLEVSPNTPSDGHFNFFVPGDLTPANDYRIRIEDVYDSNVFDWSPEFSIECPPNTGHFLDLIRPLADDVWKKGVLKDVKWSDNLPGLVEIVLFKGGTPMDTLTKGTANNGSFTYLVPDHLPVDIDYYFIISSVDEPSLFDVSDEFWVHTVNPAPDAFIEILRPDEEDVLVLGDEYLVTWEHNLVEDLEIGLWQMGSRKWGYEIPNTGSTIISVTGIQPGEYTLRLQSTVHGIINFDTDDIELVLPLQSKGGTPGSQAVNSAKPIMPEYWSLSPNPQTVGQVSTLMISAEAQGEAQLSVVDLNGKLVYEQKLSLHPGENQVEIPAGLSSGIYTVQLQTDRSLSSSLYIVRE
ncbi:MAG: Ser-Thr-rich GPI-anchored membrane family protein [Bacteroidota bacterium]